MMVGDDDVHAARVGIVNGFVGGDACVAGDDQLCAVINDWLERFNMNAVALFSANRDVVNDICAGGLQGLHQ